MLIGTSFAAIAAGARGGRVTNCLKSFSIVLVGVMLLAGPLAPAAWAYHSSPAPWIYREQDAPGKSDAAYRAGAVVTNVVILPGKVILCACSSLLALLMVVVTLGNGHREAARVMEAGCGGRWMFTAEDFKGDPWGEAN